MRRQTLLSERHTLINESMTSIGENAVIPMGFLVAILHNAHCSLGMTEYFNCHSDRTERQRSDEESPSGKHYLCPKKTIKK